MARKLHGITGEQWAVCERCGVEFPMSGLKKQRGLLICTERCWDNPDVFNRERQIEEILSQGMNYEMVDHRERDYAFFSTSWDLED